MNTPISRRALLAGALSWTTLPRQVSAANIDSDGMLRLNGKRTFVLGLYQTVKRSDGIRLAAEAGFQVIHAPKDRAFLDKAHANGLKCWLTTGSDPAAIRKIVRELKDHPAVLFWETEDEPSYQWKKPGPRVSPERIRAAYTLLKQLDPQRPVYLNHAPTNLVSTLKAYNPGGDILATDIYPVIPHGIRELYGLWETGRQGDLSDTHISQVGRYADKIREVAGPSRAAFMVLQAFAWENLREKNRDLAMVVYPTRAQLRFMAWQAVVHGMNGILWWGLSYNPAESRIWEDLVSVMKELRKHGDSLAAASARVSLSLTYHDTGHSLDRGVQWVVKPAGDGYLLVIVNADPNPVDLTFEAPQGLRISEAIDGGASARNEDSLRAQLPAFDVRLLRLAKA